MVDRYAVFGNPVAHSKSPAIHRQFAAQTGERLNYEAECVPLAGFSQAADAFFSGGGLGLNITVPFKTDAFDYAGQLSSRAEKAAAVNTLIAQADGQITGDNTDGVGLLRDLTANLGWNLANKNILVLGAGGAVRGVVAPLLQESPATLVVANRTASKAEQLARLFSSEASQHNCRIDGCGYDGLNDQSLPDSFDVVINGTSASLGKQLPAIPEHSVKEASCYDMMYGSEPTVFLQWCKLHGAKELSDGLGMLVEQAAESFYLWRNKRPTTTEVIKSLREQL